MPGGLKRRVPREEATPTDNQRSTFEQADVKSSAPLASMALVTAAESSREALLSDVMGTQVVTIYIGQARKPFTVHKNLLTATGEFFTEWLGKARERNQEFILDACEAEEFQYLVEYVYARVVPTVEVNKSPKAQAQRILELCKFHILADKLLLCDELRNKIMDNIQDGFVNLGRVPEASFIRGLYNNTKPESRLRAFCAEALLFSWQSRQLSEVDELKNLLIENNEILVDFLFAARSATEVGRDPRYRDCGGDENCAECVYQPGHNQKIPKGGFYPCTFHYHEEGFVVKPVEGEGNKSNANNCVDIVYVFGRDCYLRLPSRK